MIIFQSQSLFDGESGDCSAMPALDSLTWTAGGTHAGTYR
jgi:hypothetical protein